MAGRGENSHSHVPAKQTDVHTYGHLRPCQWVSAVVLPRIKFKKKKKKNLSDLYRVYLSSSINSQPHAAGGMYLKSFGFISRLSPCLVKSPLQGLERSCVCRS